MDAFGVIAIVSGLFAFMHLAMAIIDINFGHTDGVVHKLVVFLAASANTIAIIITVHSVSP